MSDGPSGPLDLMSPLRTALDESDRGSLRDDVVAGLTMALFAIPQAIGYSIVAGVNPVYGINAAIVSTLVASLTTGSRYLHVSLTNAISILVFSSLLPIAGSFDDPVRIEALFALTLMVGVLQLAFATLRFDRLARFVSNSVLLGFLIGAAVLMVVGQVPYLMGSVPTGDTVWVSLIECIADTGSWDLVALMVGVATIGIIVLVQHTRFRSMGLIIGLAVMTALVAISSLDLVTVGDMAGSFDGLLTLEVPRPDRHIGQLALPALAIAMVALVEAVSISESMPEPDGRTADIGRDVWGQGLANTMGAFFSCTPAGGSLSGTALLRGSGMVTRLANAFAAIWVLLLVMTMGTTISIIPLAAVSGMVIIIAVGLIRLREAAMVVEYSKVGRWSFLATFLATQLVALQYAILIGVLISMLAYLARASGKVRIRLMEPLEGGLWREHGVPRNVRQAEVVPLIVYGDLFFARVQGLEDALPDPYRAANSVVILDIRGQTDVGSTFSNMLIRYDSMLRKRGCLLKLTGVGSSVMEVLDGAGVVDALGRENVYRATKVVGESFHIALGDARGWVEFRTRPADP